MSRGATQFARAITGIFLLVVGSVGFSAIAQEVVRGKFSTDIEPVSALRPGDRYPVDAETARKRILDEAARDFSGMIYGWDFTYEPGDRSRNIEEAFTLSERGRVVFGDPRLVVTDAFAEESRLSAWIEYRLDEAQRRLYAAGREGASKNAQGTGYGVLSAGEAGKKAALDDAARAAVRSILRADTANRPKEARGYLVLSEAPRYWTDEGRFVAAGRFRVVVVEIVPYRFY